MHLCSLFQFVGSKLQIQSLWSLFPIPALSWCLRWGANLTQLGYCTGSSAASLGPGRNATFHPLVWRAANPERSQRLYQLPQGQATLSGTTRLLRFVSRRWGVDFLVASVPLYAQLSAVLSCTFSYTNLLATTRSPRQPPMSNLDNARISIFFSVDFLWTGWSLGFVTLLFLQSLLPKVRPYISGIQTKIQHSFLGDCLRP